VYRLVIALPGELDERINVPEPVVPGRVTKIRVSLHNPSYGPVVRSQAVLEAHQRLDYRSGASGLEEWQVREPVPEDILAERKGQHPE